MSPLGLLEPGSFVGSLASAAPSTGGPAAAGSARAQLVRIGELHQVLADDGIVASPAVAAAPRAPGRGWLRAGNDLAEWARTRIGEFPPTLFGLADAIEECLGVDVMVADHGGTRRGIAADREVMTSRISNARSSYTEPDRGVWAHGPATARTSRARLSGVVSCRWRCRVTR